LNPLELANDRKRQETTMTKLALMSALALLCGHAAAHMTPIGTWHTVDDATQKPKGDASSKQVSIAS
jgi:hypothetical protein